MLSGVGSLDELSKHGIETVHQLPGVGKGLKDHGYFFQFYECSESMNDKLSDLTAEGWAEARSQFLKDGTGLLPSYRKATIIGFASDPSLFATDEFNVLPAQKQAFLREPTNPGYEYAIMNATHFHPVSINLRRRRILSFANILMNPQSTGTVSLSSKDVLQPPVCDPELLTHPYDRRTAIVAVKKTLEWINTLERAEVIAKPILAPATDSEDDIWAFVRDNCITSWHMACTVRMGKPEDADACVDSDFKVHGLKNLRVVDMSVAPFLPNCHTQSIAYWLGELAAEKIAKEHNL